MRPPILCVLALTALLAFPALGGGSPARPPVAIFYYPWYDSAAGDGSWGHWNQNGHQPPNDLASQYYPTRGAYSSGDRSVVRAQMSEIAGMGVGEVVVSWWGRGSQEDQRLPMLMRAATRRGLVVAVHLEPYPARTVGSVAEDIAYLRGLGVRDVFLYNPFLLPDDGLTALNASLPDIRVFAQTTAAERAARDGFYGVYTYDVLEAHGFNALCEAARASHIACAPSVGPGFDARRAAAIPRVRPRRDGATYDHLWRMALRAQPDMVTITSYNEWHEGTQIEAARGKQFFGGRRYGTYEGAWGLHGAAASDAYLQRTAYWVARFN